MMMMVFSLRNLVVDQNQDEDHPDKKEEDQSGDDLTCEICNFILEKCSATPSTA